MSGVLGNGRREWIFGAALASAVLLLLMVGAGARAAAVYESNDTRESGYGPLAGGTWYSANIDTVNDVDWYLFYVKTYSQIEFSATATAKDTSTAYFSLYDRDGKSIYTGCCGSDLDALEEETDRLLLTMNPGRYYLEADGGLNASYKFRIDPATSITTSRECGEAIVAKDLVGPQLAVVTGDLAKNAELLATRAATVHEAKADLRPASMKVKRLRAKVSRLQQLRQTSAKPRRISAKLRNTSGKLRQARSEVRSAVEDVNRANEARQPVWQEKVNLEAIAAQHRQQIAGADGTIAAHC
ncbi:MAG TPA: hypothetical protein VD761_05350 [Solirubrobacterales bacterium]|nr:hypothetical protein [Solirubrobacterales bacterium]